MSEIYLSPPRPEALITPIHQSEDVLANFLTDLQRYRRAEEIARMVLLNKYGPGLKGRFLSALFSGSIAGDYLTRRSKRMR
jgi:hypothetical protein